MGDAGKSSSNGGFHNDESPSFTPSDVQAMYEIMESMGIDDFEPQVIYQLLEVYTKYVSDVVRDAKDYCAHRGGVVPEPRDVRLAVSGSHSQLLARQPSRASMEDTAKMTNNRSRKLPQIPDYFGMKLPPPEHLLIRPVTKVGVETIVYNQQDDALAVPRRKPRENKIEITKVKNKE